jgi:palmitoyltransferase
MLLLIYVLVTTYFVVASLAYDFYLCCRWEFDAYYLSKTPRDQQTLFKHLMIQLSYILTCMIATLMTFFLKFHIFLASSNKTTIENLEKKGRPYQSPYDLGSVNNWYQIFGTNKWLWPFPVFCGSGKPLGDGIYWRSATKEDEDGFSSGKKRET